MNTEQYYRENAQQFFEDTVHLNMSSLHDIFLSFLPNNAKILDAGCGSGRDVKAFIDKGYSVDAFDASQELSRLASQYSGVPVRTLRFNELNSYQEYDGIWCCASLLHIPYSELEDVFIRLRNACKQRGIIYISFKYGSNERQYNGRHFTDLDEHRLGMLIQAIPGIESKKVWVTRDKRAERDDNWLNALLSVT